MDKHKNTGSPKQESSTTSSFLPSPQQWQSLSSKLPKKPGVYWFLDKNKQVLYVGKAIDLKSRLSSYNLRSKASTKTIKLIKQTSFTRFNTTESDLASLLLEAKLIHLHQPPYNIRQKDDKSPLYIGITKELYPKVHRIRKNQLSSKNYHKVFGPFSSSSKTDTLLKITRKLFTFCNAPRNQNRACFYYHIKQCPGVCIREISSSDYQQIIDNIIHFLEADIRSLRTRLNRQIQSLSKNMQYEKAAVVRDKIQSLDYWLTVRRSKLPTGNLPDLKNDQHLHALTELKNLLSQYLKLPPEYQLTRIEGYDVSNIQGKFATTSMVVMTNGLIDKSQYRHFKIRSIDHSNDPAMLKETIKRRFNHPEWPYPHLIVLDGGKGQLNACLASIPINIPVISLAKDPDRIIIRPTKITSSKYKIVTLSDKTPYRRILTLLRDESHRFAKKYFSTLHAKSVNPK